MKVMKFLKHSPDVLFMVAGLISCFVLYGCGATSLGPQEPLLPTVEGQANFSDRFQLEEEPQFFYDLLVENSSKVTKCTITASRNNLMQTEN